MSELLLAIAIICHNDGWQNPQRLCAARIMECYAKDKSSDKYQVIVKCLKEPQK